MGQSPLDLHILNFIRSRIIDQSKRVNVLFLRESTPDGTDFQVRLAANLERDFPVIFSFPITDLLDPSRQKDHHDHIKKGALHWKTIGEPHTSDYAHETAELFQKMLQNPASIYDRCKSLLISHERDKILQEERANEIFLVQNLRKLPPWLLVMMMEDNAQFRYGYKSLSLGNTVGPQKGIKNLQNRFKDYMLSGLAISFDNDLEANNEKYSGSIIWKDLGDLSTLWHEIGHRLSFLYGKMQQKTNPPSSQLVRASETAKWIAASERTHFFQKFNIWVMYKKDEIPEELFAETTRLYLENYLRYSGDEEKVDAALRCRMHHLWPIYRDDIIPAFKHRANLTLNAYSQSHQLSATEHTPATQ